MPHTELVGAGAYSDIIKKAARGVVSSPGKLHKKGQKEALHNFRLSIKKLRALLPAVSAQVPPELERIFRASGRVRDLDVQRPLIRDALRAQELTDEELEDFLRARKRKARRRLRRLTRALDMDRLKVFLKDLRRCARRMEPEVYESVERIAEERRRELVSLSGALDEPDKIHQFRIKLKELTYLNRVLPADSQRRTNLEEAGELLGQWHDCVTAGRTIQRFLKKNPHARSGRVLGVLSERAAQLFSAAMKTITEAPHV